MNIKIIACGRFHGTVEQQLWDRYVRRMRWNITLIEIPDQHFTLKILQKHWAPKSFLLLLDEMGLVMSSTAFAKTLAKIDSKQVTIVIGGAYGVGSEIKNQANLVIAFGKMTWPHLLIRALLAEQLYRCEQILCGGPYHH